MEILYFVANLLRSVIAIIVSLIALVLGLYLQKRLAPESEGGTVKNQQKRKLVKILWILGLAFICLSAVTYLLTETGLFKKNIGEYYQSEIAKCQQDILYWRGEYESIDHSDPYYRNLGFADRAILVKVLREAPEIAERLEQIPSDKINLGNRILKFDLLTFILTMAAEVDTNTAFEENYLRRAFNSADTLEHLINLVKINSANDGYFKRLEKWTWDEHTVDRLHSLKAWLLAIQARLDGRITPEERERVSDELRRVSTDYRQLAPMNQNPSLRIVLENIR